MDPTKNRPPVPGIRAIEFARPAVAPPINELRRQLNRALLKTCETLPAALRMDATLFLMDLAGHPARDDYPSFDYFRHYYAPAYSVLHWVRGDRIPEPLWRAGVEAHACAMFLHLFDDHLIDGQISVDYLSLQIRTRVYEAMDQALARGRAAAADPARLAAIQEERFQRYYMALQNPSRPRTSAGADTLRDYCECFRGAMAPWLIVPEWFAVQAGWTRAQIQDLVELYESFGVAWRLLDDLQDAAVDAVNGRQDCAVYWCLTPEEQAVWRATARSAAATGKQMINWRTPRLIVKRLSGLILDLLQEAARTASRNCWPELEAELKALAGPLLPVENSVS